MATRISSETIKPAATIFSQSLSRRASRLRIPSVRVQRTKRRKVNHLQCSFFLHVLSLRFLLFCRPIRVVCCLSSSPWLRTWFVPRHKAVSSIAQARLTQSACHKITYFLTYETGRCEHSLPPLPPFFSLLFTTRSTFFELVDLGLSLSSYEHATKREEIEGCRVVRRRRVTNRWDPLGQTSCPI